MQKRLNRTLSSASERCSQRYEGLDDRALNAADVIIGQGPIGCLQPQTVGQTASPIGDRVASEDIKEANGHQQRARSRPDRRFDRGRRHSIVDLEGQIEVTRGIAADVVIAVFAMRRGEGDTEIELLPSDALTKSEGIEDTWVDLANLSELLSPTTQYATASRMKASRRRRLIDNDILESERLSEQHPNIRSSRCITTSESKREMLTLIGKSLARHRKRENFAKFE